MSKELEALKLIRRAAKIELLGLDFYEYDIINKYDEDRIRKIIDITHRRKCELWEQAFMLDPKISTYDAIKYAAAIQDEIMIRRNARIRSVN